MPGVGSFFEGPRPDFVNDGVENRQQPINLVRDTLPRLNTVVFHILVNVLMLHGLCLFLED